MYISVSIQKIRLRGLKKNQENSKGFHVFSQKFTVTKKSQDKKQISYKKHLFIAVNIIE